MRHAHQGLPVLLHRPLVHLPLQLSARRRHRQSASFNFNFNTRQLQGLPGRRIDQRADVSQHIDAEGSVEGELHRPVRAWVGERP
jgi:hypothetical protein